MTRIGDFGVPHEPVTMTFGFFDAELRVHPDVTDIAMVELFESFSTTKGTGVADALRNVGTTLIHPEDVDTFWRLAREHRQTIEDVAGLAGKLLEALTGRPTELPSLSSDGASSDGQSSTDDSSSRVLAMYRGRPDLQAVILDMTETG